MKKPFNLKKKVVGWTTALVFLNVQLFPTTSWALGGGTRQSEYEAYESTATSDMVNLVTGNLAYTLPLLNVPSPEGGFSMPLAYHSGITHGQESSWVGLGWSLNAGAITRDVAMFPDDFVTEQIENTLHDDGGHGYHLNVFGLYEENWDSEAGSGGSVGLGSIFRVGFGTRKGFTAIGVTYTSEMEDKWHGDVFTVFSSIASAYMLGTSLSLDFSSVGSAAASIGQTLVRQVIGGAISQSISNGMNGNTQQVATINDYVKRTLPSKSTFFKKEYEYFLNLETDMHVFGSLYLGEVENSALHGNNYTKLWNSSNVQTYLKEGNGSAQNIKSYKGDNSFGTTVSDVTSKDGTRSDNSIHIAYDSYNVKAPGISGGIMPLRKEVGSVAGNTRDLHEYYMPAPFFNSNDTYGKVQFIYNSNTNFYDNHLGNGNLTWSSAGATLRDYRNGNNVLVTECKLSDTHLYQNGKRIDSRNDGSMIGDKLVKANNVEWFSNAELQTSLPVQKGFMKEPVPGSTSFPANGIGGIMVTGSDGTTYHFAYPVYNKYQFAKSIRTADTDDYSSTENSNRYATAWLLTAITGSDFVDINNNGKVDESDWGYWVKMDYGVFSNHYEWRYPFSGYTQNKDNTYKSYVHGTRQNVYLNKITTRTHTALFVKDIKTDGKGFYSSAGSPVFGETKASHSLKLNEIILLKNQDYNKLVEYTSNGGYGLHYSNQGSTPATNGTTGFNGVLDVYDIADLSQSARDFIEQKQLQRIVFDTDYSLAPNTTNSYENINAVSQPRMGRLTLKSVQTYGPGNVKLIPDMTFGYTNPSQPYNPNDWDGWQFPAPGKSAAYNDHKVNPSDPIYWHLSSVNTGGGLEIEFDYERDNYYTVSGEKMGFLVKQDNNLSNKYLKEANNIPFEDAFEAGDRIYNYPFQVRESIFPPTIKTYYLDFKISSVTDDKLYYSKVTVKDHNKSVITSESSSSLSSLLPGYDHIHSGKMEYKNYNKTGGDVRVSMVTLTDHIDNTSKRTKYLYTFDATETGISSGVCSKEPEYIKSSHYDFYDYYDYASTPVLYGMVTVLNDYQTDGDYLSKNIYSFFTPDADMIEARESTDQNYHPEGWSGRLHRTKNYFYDMKTSKIGQLAGIINANKYNEIVSRVNYEYFTPADLIYDQNKLGIYSMGALKFSQGYVNNVQNNYLVRTSTRNYPTIPKTVIFKDATGTKEVYNTDIDLLTGAVLKSKYKDSWGGKFETEVVPAYTVYSGMASKAISSSNKNMLSQIAYEKLYAYNENNVKEEISAFATVWDNNWSYRKMNSTYSDFTDVNRPNGEWRIKEEYVWNDNINPDGSYVGFTDFDHSSSTHPDSWLKLYEITRYNPFSHPIEARSGVSGQYSSLRQDNRYEREVLSATNTRYKEALFTSFEEASYEYAEIQGITADNIRRVPSYAPFHTDVAHTGKKSVKLTGSSGVTGTIEFEGNNNKVFYSQVWVYKTGKDNFRMKANLKLQNGSTVNMGTISATESVQAGDWSLVTMKVDVSSYSNPEKLEFTLFKSGSAPAIVDDWKVVPFNSTSNTYVYD
ncbi:MAG TPA: hypothetical protein DDW81_16135, partial [Cryomorphaceae bacterium]|nr:hypothetical protein [Cryomorphaceae bacterium]